MENLVKQAADVILLVVTLVVTTLSGTGAIFVAYLIAADLKREWDAAGAQGRSWWGIASLVLTKWGILAFALLSGTTMLSLSIFFSVKILREMFFDLGSLILSSPP